MAFNYASTDSYQQKSAKSSVLRSFMHKRNPSAGIVLSPTSANDGFIHSQTSDMDYSMQFLPRDHPHSRALSELQQNQQRQPQSPAKKSREVMRPDTNEEVDLRPRHKKTLSSYSLKSLAGRDTDKASKSKDKEAKPKKPKKTKSSTNLANLLLPMKSTRSLHKQAMEEEARAQKDKENQRPTAASPTEREIRPPPIYAQFSSQHFTKKSLGGKSLEDEIDLYTPQQYSPGKQRNFYQGPDSQPSLGRPHEPSPRSRSTYLPSNFSLQDISRRISNGSRSSAEIVRRVSGAKRPSLDRGITTKSAKSEKTQPLHRGEKGMALMSNTSSMSRTPGAKGDMILDDEDIDREFEAMLDRRNIPEHQRGKMRSLANSMKKDFIKQDWAEIAASKNGRPGTNSSNSSADVTEGTHSVPEVKSKRPRSRTFTLSRASSKENKEPSSPIKKHRPESTFRGHSRTKSTESIKEGSKSFAASGAAVAQTFLAKAKGQLPDDFVSYLRKVQKPELVEVGRLHKLRLLLRNETVAWTDEFIRQGGMEEIVGLLHRIMAVEWREEHEDTLLHETLLCLKALSTTELALEHLNKMQVTLFPALLHMIFDEEKKGPSEFTTRNIISSLLFVYLKSSPLSERAHRAMKLLSYLKDPEPSESQRPVGFVLEMHQPRPYRVWCKEVVNVTKEVFWIFLHNLNVIALPSDKDRRLSCDNGAGSTSACSSSNSSFDISNPHHVYMFRHFPQELPPVPAAPYVGGVEWDATNYLASHLDIINGILACLPTQEERNNLREQLRASGWEKCMGVTLRLCKEKFYGGVHAGLRCWVAAAAEDGWNTRDVRCGPPVENKNLVRKSPKKGPVEQAPKIEMKLDFSPGQKKVNDDAWL